MASSRRSFLQLISVNGLAVAAGACAPRTSAALAPAVTPAAPAPGRAGGLIRLSANENSNGPGEQVLEAIHGSFGVVNRYPFELARTLTSTLAGRLGVSADQLMLGCGSSEILDAAVLAFTAPDRGLVTAAPTFELAGDSATRLGHPVAAVPVTTDLGLDLATMSAKAPGAGLAYICNPNNPTGTLHGGDAIERFVSDTLAREPRATILIDEAYHEYVDRPDYRTAIPLALANPRVIVSRTFSKIYGLAGMRVGYAVGRAETLKAMAPFVDDMKLGCLSTTAALAALADTGRPAEQHRLNQDAKAYTVRMLTEAGYPPIPSQANFLMVDVRRDIRVFQDACRQRGVGVARPFPPLLTYARISIGTMDEMTRAAAVFKDVLAQPATSAAVTSSSPLLWRDGPREC
jgi:histidinol-phosphate aminotransferase